MPQILALVDTLKQVLKANGLTYRDVANSLSLSEASIKRLFAQHNFSMIRLEQICQLMDMEISDLVNMMEIRRQTLTELTEEQEKELVSDSRFLLVTFLVVNRCKFNEIVLNYRFTSTETIRYLARLDRLKLIDLLPNNRIKLRISSNFSWRRNGPIQEFFVANLQQDFLNSRFEDRGESFYFLSGMLSEESRNALIKRLQQLAGEFNTLNRQDAQIPFDQRLGHSLFLAIRPWRADVFDQWQRTTK
ncbi:MAG: helix-turn-helix transcriptional regulator [Methylococcales bacterium]